VADGDGEVAWVNTNQGRGLKTSGPLMSYIQCKLMAERASVIEAAEMDRSTSREVAEKFEFGLEDVY
jgi:hypothetical protein